MIHSWNTGHWSFTLKRTLTFANKKVHPHKMAAYDNALHLNGTYSRSCCHLKNLPCIFLLCYFGISAFALTPPSKFLPGAPIYPVISPIFFSRSPLCAADLQCQTPPIVTMELLCKCVDAASFSLSGFLLAVVDWRRGGSESYMPQPLWLHISHNISPPHCNL